MAARDASFIENLLFGATMAPRTCSGRNDLRAGSFIHVGSTVRSGYALRKLIAFDDDTLDKLTQLGRDRMATFQELADEAFADLLKKHGVPIDLKDALRKSARKDTAPRKTGSKAGKAAS
jgi:hypothetical protein